MASGHPHGYEYDLFVSYSTRDLGWVRQFHDDLVEDVNRFVRFDVFPFLDKARLQPGYVWHEKLPFACEEATRWSNQECALTRTFRPINAAATVRQIGLRSSS